MVVVVKNMEQLGTNTQSDRHFCACARPFFSKDCADRRGEESLCNRNKQEPWPV